MTDSDGEYGKTLNSPSSSWEKLSSNENTYVLSKETMNPYTSRVDTPSVFKRGALNIKVEPNPHPEDLDLVLPTVDELDRANFSGSHGRRDVRGEKTYNLWSEFMTYRMNFNIDS